MVLWHSCAIYFEFLVKCFCWKMNACFTFKHSSTKKKNTFSLLVFKTSLFLFMWLSLQLHPGRLTLHLNMMICFRWFSFSKRGDLFLGSILVNLPGWFITAFQLESFLKQTLRSQDSSIPSWKASHWPSAQSYTCRLQPPWRCCENPRSRWSSWAESHGGLKPEKIPSFSGDVTVNGI